MTAVELDPQLEQEIRDALPEGCEVAKACGHLCNEPPAWSITLRCDCAHGDSALICAEHIDWTRTTDFICTTCCGPISVVGVKRL
jgi:hypothetical protein